MYCKGCCHCELVSVLLDPQWLRGSLLHLQQRDTFGLIRRKKHIFLMETCIEPCVTKTSYEPVLLTDCSSASMLTTENIKDKDLIICPTEHDTLAVWTLKFEICISRGGRFQNPSISNNCFWIYTFFRLF